MSESQPRQPANVNSRLAQALQLLKPIGSQLGNLKNNPKNLDNKKKEIQILLNPIKISKAFALQRFSTTKKTAPEGQGHSLLLIGLHNTRVGFHLWRAGEFPAIYGIQKKRSWAFLPAILKDIDVC